jgi:hypothetical protein
VVKLKLARGAVLGFRLDWTRNELYPAQYGKKEFIFQNIFSRLK